jgi:hypothetical protein
MWRKFTTLLQYPVAISISFVATSSHSKFMNLVSRWRFDPSSNYEAGSCECGNEPSGSIKRGEFLD